MDRGFARIAGVDEVGRGPLAGPVTACAVVLDMSRIPEGLNDSKKLSAKRRESLAEAILACAEVSVASASVEEIDELNILRASHLAMERAVAGLLTPPDHCLIDGNLIPKGLTVSAEAIVKGDSKSEYFCCFDCGQNQARLCHVGTGATVPGLRLGNKRRISIKKSQTGAAKSWCDPTP